MLVLIHDEWPKARWNLVNLSTQSTHNAIQAWMQATQVQARASTLSSSPIAHHLTLQSLQGEVSSQCHPHEETQGRTQLSQPTRIA